ncbi:MAG TPA: FHA domain-containing protein [Candidatus Sulfotelmatobacter sp.]|nr:FHA domain-containing protein [Candidatus Sulfotelmatobacter sp.]
MAKLVVLTQSMAGRSIDLAGERTTVGRVEDNAFQIAEPSVSSRHCEILLRGEDIVVKDLNSTNGTFINGEKISESVLKPGQTLRLGNVELKLDVPGAPVAPAAPSPSAPAPDAAPVPSTPPAAPATSTASTKKTAATGGVSVSDLGGGGRTPGFDTTSKDFTKKKASKAMYFWIVVGVALLILIILIVVVISSAKGSAPAT